MTVTFNEGASHIRTSAGPESWPHCLAIAVLRRAGHTKATSRRVSALRGESHQVPQRLVPASPVCRPDSLTPRSSFVAKSLFTPRSGSAEGNRQKNCAKVTIQLKHLAQGSDPVDAPTFVLLLPLVQPRYVTETL